jgi:hypothetical protein
MSPRRLRSSLDDCSLCSVFFDSVLRLCEPYDPQLVLSNMSGGEFLQALFRSQICRASHDLKLSSLRCYGYMSCFTVALDTPNSTCTFLSSL